MVYEKMDILDCVQINIIFFLEQIKMIFHQNKIIEFENYSKKTNKTILKYTNSNSIDMKEMAAVRRISL